MSEKVAGNDGSNFENARKQELETLLGSQTAGATKGNSESSGNDSQQTEPDKEGNVDSQVQSKNTDSNQDATNDLTKYDNILINTFGFEEGEITDKDRKVAKSWKDVQSLATKSKQEANQHKQVVDNLNSVLGKYPSLYQKLEQAAKGQYQENPIKQDSSQEQPQSKGQLTQTEVSEDTLIESGLLNKSDLDGLDELARDRKVFQAEMKYVRQQEADNYFKDLQSKQQDLLKQQEAERIKGENKSRLEEGFNNVLNTGTNFAELEPQVVRQIQKRVAVTLDPNDPRLVAKDAFEIITPRVLAEYGIEVNMPKNDSQKANVANITDTGTSVSRAQSQQSKKLTLEEQLDQKAKKRAVAADPNAKFKVKLA